MNIMLVGFYEENAYSDDFLGKAVRDAFNVESGDTITWRTVNFMSPLMMDFDADLVIMGGGSLLGVPMPVLERYLKRDDTPFIVLGTGVRFSNGMPIKNSKYLLDRSSLLSVRGLLSLKEVNTLGDYSDKIRPCGDPIFLLNDEHQEKDAFLKGVLRPRSSYDNIWMEKCFLGLSSKMNLPIQLIPMSQNQGDLGEVLGFNETYDEVCRASFWFGNRLHPFCVALINNIPAIAVEIEFNKVEDACSIIKYPYWVHPGDDIYKTCDLLAQNWDSDREMRNREIANVKHGLMDIVREALKL